MAVGLFLTTSRGAILGVGCSLALGIGWLLVKNLFKDWRRLTAYLALCMSAISAICISVALLPPLRTALENSQAIADRLDILYEAALLIRDYPFTGIGLGQFPLVHSTYALMIRVPVLPYAHSMFADIALAQGIPGLLVALSAMGIASWLGLGTLEHVVGAPPALAAGLLSMPVLLVHGMVDSALYSGRGMLLLWVPAGLIIAGRQSTQAEIPPAARGLTRKHLCVWGVVAVAALLCAAFFWRPIAATWYANLGAMHQARTELSLYDHQSFGDFTIDHIRRQADLSRIERLYSKGLELDPGQVTAQARLAGIALSKRRYEEALAHTRTLWNAGYRDRITRLLRGDALVATGDMLAGVETVRGLEWAAERFDTQAYYRYWTDHDYRRAADAWRAVVELNPANRSAAQSAEAAEAKIGTE
jgi:hypothetical protein